jgi:hypothetical protein
MAQIARSMADVLSKHVTWELEGIDRMYMNIYVPRLQRPEGIAWFFRGHRGARFASSALMEPMSRDFAKAMETFAKRERVPLITFVKGQRKDEVTLEHLARFKKNQGVLFIGKAQEKATVVRTERRGNPKTGQTYPWLVRATAMVNQYYAYCVDEDFGPFFWKFSSYFPYNAKLCINGHEYLKRQLDKRGVKYEPLDNGLLSCAEPKRAQQICDNLSADKIDALLRKWLRRLPHPFTKADRVAGYRYDVSILQAEFALTQVLDRPVTGRVFFEEVIRENLDVGRPSQVQLIFGRRVSKATPGRSRTRVLTEGVIPSLHVDYKKSKIKQYHKEGRALRTETTIQDTYDFDIGRRLQNLPKLRKVGFEANRRLLDVQKTSHDCTVGEDAFRQIVEPVHVEGQRASGLRFGDLRVMALLQALLLFVLLPRGFSNRNLRVPFAQALGIEPSLMTQGMMTYQLRRLRLHGLIERIPRSHRYRITPDGLRSILFFTKTYARIFRPGLAHIAPVAPAANSPLRNAFDRVDAAVQSWCDRAHLAAQQT